MAALTDEIGPIHQKVIRELGVDPAGWARWPGGWPDDIEAALVDAVFSARAVYKHVHPRVATWRGRRARTDYRLSSLLAEIDGAGGPRDWAAAFGNSQHSPGRPASAPGGPLKAATIREAANHLASIGVDRAADIHADNAHQVRATTEQVKGLGRATSNYFLILLGTPGVKPDRMIHRFLGDRYTNAQAERVISAVAERMAVAPHKLDHAIWAYESHQATQR